MGQPLLFVVATSIVKAGESWYNTNMRTWLVKVRAVHLAEQAVYHLSELITKTCRRLLVIVVHVHLSGRFAIVAVSEAGHPVSITDKGMTDLEFAEVVKWTYRTYFADETVSTSAAVSPEAPLKEKALAERGEGYVTGETSEDASLV